MRHRSRRRSRSPPPANARARCCAVNARAWSKLTSVTSNLSFSYKKQGSQSPPLKANNAIIIARARPSVGGAKARRFPPRSIATDTALQNNTNFDIATHTAARTPPWPNSAAPHNEVLTTRQTLSTCDANATRQNGRANYGLASFRTRCTLLKACDVFAMNPSAHARSKRTPRTVTTIFSIGKPNARKQFLD